jgi:transketolase
MENKTDIRLLSMLGQRGALGASLLSIAPEFENLMVLTGDLSNTSGLDRFQAMYPEKFINTGIAEQHMIGMAAGLASEGYIPFTTTFATFASMRCLEQVRVNGGYMKLNFKVVGLASGFAMGQFGNTHYGIEDIAIMRSIPNMVVLSPADSLEVKKSVIAAANHEGPVYIRLTGGMNNPIVYKDDYKFNIGKSNLLKKGERITFFATGSMVYYALKVAKALEKHNVYPTVINMNTIKPLDNDTVIEHANISSHIVTIEEHNIIGGLGSAIAETLASSNINTKQLFIGVNDCFSIPGSYDYLLESNQLTEPQILERVLMFIK